MKKVKVKYGFVMKDIGLDARSSMISLECYMNAAGVQVKDIRTREQFWKTVESVYQIKIDRKLDDDSALNVACIVIASKPRCERRKLQKEYRTAPQREYRNKVVERLEKENAAFYANRTPAPKSSKPPRLPKAPKGYTPSKAEKEAFYKSWDWQTARMEVLIKYGRRCLCCGATPEHTDMLGNPVMIVVDHIRPLHTAWHLRLDRTQMQPLCQSCNMGKGAWDETDHRPKPIEGPDEWIIEDDIPEHLREQLKIRN